VKVDASRIQAIAKQWPPGLRVVLLHGADSSASQDLAGRIARGFADPANPLPVEELTGKAIAADPQALVAAAGALSMFGDRTLVRVDGADDDSVDAVTALLASPAGNPVLMVAGPLKKGSKLQALADREKAIEHLASYEPSLRDAPRMVGDLGAELGLRIGRDAAIALFESAGGDRSITRSEVEKLSLYLDSDSDRGRQAELADVAAIGVGAGDSDQYELVAAIASGRPAQTAALLARQSGVAIPVLRALDRRFSQLLGLRQAVDAGSSPRNAVEAARPPIFWKEKDAFVAELGLWTTPGIVAALGAILAAESAIKSANSLGEILAYKTMLDLARRAAAGRR
jgi:DNA polymerase-3 subunit delta